EDRRSRDLRHQALDFMVGMQAAAVEIDFRLHAQPLAQRLLQIGLKSADPADVLGVSLVVEMRVADEYVVLVARYVCHRNAARSSSCVAPGLRKSHLRNIRRISAPLNPFASNDPAPFSPERPRLPNPPARADGTIARSDTRASRRDRASSASPAHK